MAGSEKYWQIEGGLMKDGEGGERRGEERGGMTTEDRRVCVCVVFFKWYLTFVSSEVVYFRRQKRHESVGPMKDSLRVKIILLKRYKDKFNNDSHYRVILRKKGAFFCCLCRSIEAGSINHHNNACVDSMCKCNLCACTFK